MPAGLAAEYAELVLKLGFVGDSTCRVGQQCVLPPHQITDADVTIEAVGVPETFELCARLVRAGGRVANVGVHGKPATLHLEDLWIKDVTITTGLVDGYSTLTLLNLIRTGQLDVGRFVTHRFAVHDFEAAYDTFSRANDTGALKVVVSRA